MSPSVVESATAGGYHTHRSLYGHKNSWPNAALHLAQRGRVDKFQTKDRTSILTEGPGDVFRPTRKKKAGFLGTCVGGKVPKNQLISHTKSLEELLFVKKNEQNRLQMLAE